MTYNVLVEALLLFSRHFALRLLGELFLQCRLLRIALLLLDGQDLSGVGIVGAMAVTGRVLAPGKNLVFSLSWHELRHAGGDGVEVCSHARQNNFGGDCTLARTLCITPAASFVPSAFPHTAAHFATTMAAATTSADYVVTPAPYLARKSTATSAIKGLETTATAVNFADKIVITVTQNGRLAHWVWLHIFECNRSI